MKSSSLAAFVLAAATMVPAVASAQVSYEVGLVAGTSDTGFVQGMSEVFARVDNRTNGAVEGMLVVRDHDGQRNGRGGRARFAVAPNSSALVRVPFDAPYYAVRAEVVQGGLTVATKQLNVDSEQAVRVFDATRDLRARVLLDGVPLKSAPATRSGPPSMTSRIRVAAPFVDPATGVPVFPQLVTTWHGFPLVVMSTATFIAMPLAEQRALAGHVLSGATLAFVVSRPEDLRDPAIIALFGAEPTAVPPADITRSELPPPTGGAPSGDRFGPAPNPPELVRLASYSGGNTLPSLFGGSATYGIGEVVMLGFDLDDANVAKEHWTGIRMVELARRAGDRAKRAAVRPGSSPTQGGGFHAGAADELRPLLDPNTSNRWGIGVASLFLCAYAVVAGPVTFSWAKKKNQPLRALLYLPVLSLAAFVILVVFGFVSKGVSRRANHVTFIDAGAGMEEAGARRYRSFFSPFAQTIDLRPTDSANMLTTLAIDVPMSGFEVDGDGVRIAGVEATPGQAMIFREEGLASLGGHVAITPGSDPDSPVITNRLRSALRGVLVKMPAGSLWYRARIEPGESVTSADMVSVVSWLGPDASLYSELPPLNAHGMRSTLQNLGEAEAGDVWVAVEPNSGLVNWFPSGVPVLLAVVDGGFGTKKDSGVSVEKDAVAIRVVGFGGKAP